MTPRVRYMPVEDSALVVTGARPFHHAMQWGGGEQDACAWPDDAINEAQAYSGDPLDAPDLIPAGSTASLGATWCPAFTTYLERDPS